MPEPIWGGDRDKGTWAGPPGARWLSEPDLPELETPARPKVSVRTRDKLGCIMRSLNKSTPNFQKTLWARADINSRVSHSN